MKLLFLTMALILLAPGLLFVGLAFLFRKRRVVMDVRDSTRLTEISVSTQRPYRGIVVPLHYPIVAFRVRFVERNGLAVEATLQDLVSVHDGHMVATYDSATGPHGEIGTSLESGTYDVHFRSTDDNDREIDFRLHAIEARYPFRTHLDVALAAVTIGVVFLVEALTIVD